VPLDVDRVPVRGTWWRQVRSGLDPLELRDPRADGRWQRGRSVGAVYLADEADTAWAEWYRALAELALPPTAWLPRDLWQVEVSLDEVADLSDEGRLRRVGLDPLQPDRVAWPPYQDAGAAIWREGCQGLIAPSAARPDNLVLCVFERDGELPGLGTRIGPAVVEEPPVPPRGLRT
jgi:RES domain-containing protein